MVSIIKRNGDKVPFNGNKIKIAILKANDELSEQDRILEFEVDNIADYITSQASNMDEHGNIISVEEVQDMVETELMAIGNYELAKAYIKYRYKHQLIRERNTTDQSILSLIDLTNKEVMEENSNKSAQIASTQRDLMAGEVSKDITWRILLPNDIRDAHDKGILHFHDADYFAQHIKNCCLVNMEDVFANGTVINGTEIESPKSFLTACTIMTQVMAIVASSQYGGQTMSLSHLAPFIDVSRKKLRKKVKAEMYENVGYSVTNSMVDAIAESRLKDEVKSGVQTLQYQILTISSSNGQTPFVSLFMYLNEVEDGQTRADLAMLMEEVFKQRIQGVKNEKGVYITPPFPKLLYVLQEDNITEGSKYYYLTELAAKCIAKRMVPDCISEKVMKELKIDENGNGQCYPCMGCRSFLTPYVDPKTGKPKYYGRFNQGVVTINLADVGLSANKDMDKFWEIYEERLELCHKALRLRHERLKGTKTSISPVHWQYGGLSRLDKDGTIDDLLYNGYSTLSLGFAGLYECCMAMTGKSHTDPSVTPFALEVMQMLNDKCAQWKQEENIAYSVYGSPIESTTYHFARTLKERFGVIEGITDRNYVTNSYHVFVGENINAFDKLTFEAQFQKLSPGGAISYVEVPNLENNLDAVLAVMKHIYNTIMYAELNTKSDYCMVCGWDREIEIKEKEDGSLYWCCPNCGNTDQNRMNVTRRTCGYLGSQFWNQGRTQEIKDRVLHL